MQIHTDFILASQSPRRRKLLRQIGVSFIHISPNVDETVTKKLTPEELVEHLSLRKAASIAERKTNALILGADTIVVSRGLIFGKPSGAFEAADMLRQLSGSTHIVHTGIALVHKQSERIVSVVESTEVTFGRLTETEISNYVKTGAPLDKAGAYGIQDDLGALFIEQIHGDYYNVVGLPLRRLYTLLKEHFSDLITF
ncbi:MAG: Maf family protein [Bacteroidetes bacterium]|nr:Maf family protein [Bacteroidota bacterium]